MYEEYIRKNTVIKNYYRKQFSPMIREAVSLSSSDRLEKCNTMLAKHVRTVPVFYSVHLAKFISEELETSDSSYTLALMAAREEIDKRCCEAREHLEFFCAQILKYDITELRDNADSAASS